MLRVRIFSGSLLVVCCLSLGSLASALDVDCYSQPSDHPCWGGGALGFSPGAVDLAESVDKENQRRMAEGDCAGLDHEGCLGVMISNVYCWLVGCLTPPDDPPGNGDPAPGDPPSDPPADPPADPGGPEPDDPKEEPQNQQANSSAEFVGMRSQRFNQRTREVLEKLQPGSVVTRIPWQDGTELEVVLVQFLETTSNNRREYVIFLDIIDPNNPGQHRIVMGGQGNIVYALTLETFLRALRN